MQQTADERPGAAVSRQPQLGSARRVQIKIVYQNDSNVLFVSYVPLCFAFEKIASRFVPRNRACSGS